MKKIVWTTVVDGYFPELCALTLPNHEAYAKRIGADFRIISDRKYPEWHPTYEKVQIHELGKDAYWNIHIDADLLVSPTLHDATEVAPSIVWYSIYDPALYFACDEYFAKDGRRIGVCSAFIAVPKSCHAMWTPFEWTYEQALKGINKPHGIDDYCFSRNFARYNLPGAFLFNHESDLSNIVHMEVGGTNWQEEKLQLAKETLKKWSSS